MYPGGFYVYWEIINMMMSSEFPAAAGVICPKILLTIKSLVENPLFRENLC